MKKLWIAGMIVGTMAFAGCGGHDKVYYNTTRTYSSTNGIPNRVVDKFYEMYPSAENVNWNVKDGLYKADFEINDEDMDASFSPDGNLVKVNS
jgi:hypothetical protein